MAVSDWFTVAASNIAVDGISIAEGCDPGNLNDALRAIVADVAEAIGIWNMGGVQSGATNALLIDKTATSAHVDGTTQLYSMVNRVFGQGANSYDHLRAIYTGAHLTTTAGTCNLLSGVHAFAWVGGAGNATAANVFEGHLVVDSTGSVTNQANYYNCASVTFGGAGTVNIVVGYNCNQISDVIQTTTAYSFNAQHIDASALAVNFRSEMTAATNRWGFLQAGGAQNGFLGKTKLGATTAPAEMLDVLGNVIVDGELRTKSGRVGYATGAGSTVTQVASRTNGVTMNRVCGEIDLFSAAGSASWTTFTVTNSFVGANDTIRVCQKTGTDKYQIHVTRVAVGAFDITFATTGGTTTEQPVFNFSVISGANS